MKKNWFCLILIFIFLAPCFCLLTACGEEEQPYTRVVILSGQSNMQGSARIDLLSKESLGEERYERITTPFENIKIVSELGNDEVAVPEFTTLKLGIGAYYKNGFGPEIGMAEELSKCEGDTYFIKCAFSGTSLEDYWRSPSMTADGQGSPMWRAMTEFVDSNLKKLEDAGLNPKIVAFCWMQGEADASNPDVSMLYRKNLSSFVGDLRLKYNAKSVDERLHFIDAKINSTGLWPFHENVNRAKEEYAQLSPYNHILDTTKPGLIKPGRDGLIADEEASAGQTEVDPLHYDTTSQLMLGNMFAKEIRAIARI